MLKKIFLIITAVISFSQYIVGDDYYNYGQWTFSGNSIGGFIDKSGKLGEAGKEYILYVYGNTGYIYSVDTDGDPQMHPDNPDSTGEVSKRTFTFISSHYIPNARTGTNAFFVDDTGIYYGPCGGTYRWDFNWENETKVIDSSFCGETFAGNPRTGDFWAGGRYRKLYKWDGSKWAYQFTYPNLGGGHHDGMTIANDILFVSDMTSDFIATYKLDKDGNVINKSEPDHKYSYHASPAVENMGFGPNNHIWITSGSVIYEIGGGKLQEQLASCTQGLTISDKWEMLSSRCDIKNATGFSDAVILKMVGDHLVAITTDEDIKLYYESLGYETNSSLELSRGEGFWIKAKTDGIRHALNGVEESVSIHLKKDTTRFIGLPDWHSLDLDETFGDKPVKEVRYWDSNTSSWRRWQKNHYDTNLTQIVDGHGFYICVSDDFDISLPNLAPSAIITGDFNITVGNPLSLSGIKSFDRDGVIVNYQWREGNETLSNDIELHKDDLSIGWHKIVLSVIDDDGATNSQEVIIRVSKPNILPTVELGDDINITQGEDKIIYPDVSDSDGYIISYEWSLDGELISISQYLALDNFEVGEYNLTLKVIDNELGVAADSIRLNVNPLPDTVAPVITILGENPKIININDTYIDQGAVAIDDRDENVSVRSEINVDTTKVGEYYVDYFAQDKAGNQARKTRVVHVQNPVSNAIPTVDLGEDKTIVEGESVYLYAKANDIDGYIKSYRWQGFGDIDVDGPNAKISSLKQGLYTITVSVEDDKQAKASDSISIKVLSKSNIDDKAPIITIKGDNPTILQVGDSYIDAGATAWDDIDGNLSVGVEYNISTSKVGTCLVKYSAHDSSGNEAIAYRSVLISDNSTNQDDNTTNDESDTDTKDDTPPLINLIGDNPYIIWLNQHYNEPGVIVIDDRDGVLGYRYQTDLDISNLGSYKMVYTAVDSAGNESNATRKIYVKDPLKNYPPIAYAGDDVRANIDESIILDGSGSYDVDGDIVSYEWIENAKVISQYKTLKVAKQEFGLYTYTLRVKDNDGLESVDSVIVRIIDPSDTTSPEVDIESSMEDEVVKLKKDILGRIYDEHLDYYVIEVSPVGKNEYVEIARGESNVEDGVLGLLDATVMSNGIYDVRVSAYDKNGAKSEAYSRVIIDGKAKIGNFSFTVTDLNLQVGGIPVSVNRTYSTLKRFEKGDFTYGWSIDYQNVKIEENIVPGEEWRLVDDPNTILVAIGYCFKPKKDHLVNISLPDGTTERFKFEFTRECGHYFPNHFYDAPVLKTLGGSTAKLETIDASDVVMMNDYGQLIDGHTLEVYNPSLYRLTLANGMVYHISQKDGIYRIVDMHGDELVYTKDGIKSSRLKEDALHFTRDSKGRIIKITDLSGRSVEYHYDSHEDMDRVIDQGGAKTTYTYQDGHLLEEYIDPSGLRVAKNIYDESGRLIKTIDADGNEVEFSHDIDGKEEVVTDRLGRVSLYVYDEDGNVISQTNPLGETTLRTYDSNGNELSVTNPLGETTTNEYDENDNLLSITDALGYSEVTTYNDKNSPTTISDKNGNTMTIEYDSYNAPVSMTTANGAVTNYTYDGYGDKVAVINEYNVTTRYAYGADFIVPYLGKITSDGLVHKETRDDGTVIEYTYDKRGNTLTTTTTLSDGTTTTTSNSYDVYDRVVSSTDERGNTTTYTYDDRGNKTSTTDSQGRVTRYEYNNHNKLTKTIYPDGTIESKTYDAMDNLISETNQEGYTTTYSYDDANRLIKTTYPDNTTTINSYDKAGRVTSTTDQNGNTTTYTYDAVGNKLSQTDALGYTTTYTYDAQGNLLSVTDALNHTTRYEYNALNQRVKTVYPDGTSVIESKNISGLPQSKTDQKGRVTLYGYDTKRVIPLLNQITLPNNTTTTYTYDSQGKKTAQTDALNHTTTYTYTTTGELKTQILPSGETKTFSYDDTGKQTQVTDYANKTQKFIYDSYDRLVRIEYSDGSTITYDYTPSGKIKSITNSQGTIEKTYDSIGRLKTQTNPNGDTITYTYDGVGNIIQIETPTQTISKTYDALNRLSSVTDNKGTTTYTYDALSRQTKVTYPNGVSTNYEYDSSNRVTKIEHTNSNSDILQSFSYTYDEVGNRLSETRNDNTTINYEYNEVNQLTKATITNDPNGNNTTTTYSYDAVGNLVSKTVEGVEHTYVYDSNDRLIEKDGTTLSYDANGNLIDDGTNSYEWDDKNRLTKVITPNDTIEYIYDAQDNRIAKVINGESTTYLIDTNTPFAQVITESKENGTEIYYTYGNDLISDNTHYFLTDALGSTRGLVDSDENLTDSYDYKPYGELLAHNGTSDNDFLFTGEQLDQETDNYYLRARYYSPNFTRFLSRDSYDGTLDSPFSQNHYLYTHSNPVNYIDPSGHILMAEITTAMSLRNTVFSVRTQSLGLARKEFMKVFGCDIMGFVAEESIKEGIYLYLANGFSQDAKPYVGKTKRTFRQRLKEHLDKSIWKNKTAKKLKDMSHVIERFHFKVNSDELLETIEQIILDALGGPEKTANTVNPMGGRQSNMPNNIDKIKKIICKGK